MITASHPPQGARTVLRALTHLRKGLLTQVHAAAGESDGRFPAAFARLVVAIEAAFRHEETLMDMIGFPGVREQRRDNALLLKIGPSKAIRTHQPGEACHELPNHHRARRRLAPRATAHPHRRQVGCRA